MKKTTSLALMLMMVLMGRAQSINAYHQYSVECLGVAHDGSQTLRVYGYGKKEKDAQKQAMREAVWTVIFKGVRDGQPGCNIRPLITETNAEEKYEDYFHRFFADKGKWKKYVEQTDDNTKQKVKKKNKTRIVFEITARVNRTELKKRLEKDNILKTE